MKRLRNTGIYYTLFGILLAVSFVFTKLWPISLLGIALLELYLLLRFVFHRRRLPFRLGRNGRRVWDVFLVLLPFLYVALTTWYINRPYRQTIVLPDGYEGVVAIQYDKPDGQPEKWTDGFLGLGASRLIMVDSTGMAETQFGFHRNAVPWLGLKQTFYNKGGMKICYAGNPAHEIVTGADGQHRTAVDKYGNKPGIYFTGLDYYPLMVLVVVNPADYDKYFMTEEEMVAEYRKEHNEDPAPHTFSDIRKLKKKYNHYYELQSHQLKD